ncbi:MAG: putative cytochrome c oxidase subunit 3 [Chloroflexota bacterium]
MSAAVAHGQEHIDPVAHAWHRVRINRLGLWLFLISDGALFAIFAASRFYIGGTATDPHLNQALGLAITSLLLLSSFSAYRAETAFAHGNTAHGRTMLLATIVMGLAFAGGVAYEWSIAEFSVSEAYGTAFFSMTGMHAFHVMTGILFLTLIWAKSGNGRYSGGPGVWPVTATVIYWHFVDVVWVFFYPTLYLLK